MWGQEAEKLDIAVNTGIIPTRVGTSRGSSTLIQSQTDHPHACGDKQTGDFKVPVIQGSSPRVWGQVTKVCTIIYCFRIIPTRVGTRLA